MSLYAEYILEKDGFKTIEGKDWFFTYSLNKKEDFIFVSEMFMRKRKRSLGSYRTLIKNVFEASKNENVSTVFAKVELGKKHSDYVLGMHKKMGFKVYDKTKSDIYVYIHADELKKFLR